jgi:hypothetical protein
VTLMMQYMVVMGIPLMATGCGYECTVLYVTFMKVKSALFLPHACVLKFFSQVELAHGGRGQSYSHDPPRSFSSGRRGGVSRRSEYRGLYLHLLKR